jgi:hypothetical protein
MDLCHMSILWWRIFLPHRNSRHCCAPFISRRRTPWFCCVTLRLLVLLLVLVLVLVLRSVSTLQQNSSYWPSTAVLVLLVHDSTSTCHVLWRTWLWLCFPINVSIRKFSLENTTARSVEEVCLLRSSCSEPQSGIWCFEIIACTWFELFGSWIQEAETVVRSLLQHKAW